MNAGGLERLNSLPPPDAEAELLKCCGSTRWASLVAARRPFRDASELFVTADAAWWSLGPEDWLEAFRSHPKIGEKKPARETGRGAQRWSEEEQSDAHSAASDTLDALSSANRAYEERFGHIFIVCATGKTAVEMLALLHARLPNDARVELSNAAEEQRRITRLRLEKLLTT